jgi:NADPH:quinone reductase-like Zn-dependent oxidoreductase
VIGPCFKEFLDDVMAGVAADPVARRYAPDEIQDAHADMKSGSSSGKLVVVL